MSFILQNRKSERKARLCRSKETYKIPYKLNEAYHNLRYRETEDKFYNTDLTGLPLLNSFLVLKGTDTSVVPILPSGGVGGVGGSEKQQY